MTRRVVEKLCTKKVCVDFLAPISINFKSFSPPKICPKKSFFFTARLCRGSHANFFPCVPSDTKLLLTKNYSKIIIFLKNYESHA